MEGIIMAEKSFSLDFKGYRREGNISGLPSISGVYCVYVCSYNADKDTVSLKNLIYIGESDDINDRINGHERWDDWESHVGSDEELCFSYVEVDSYYRERVEAALIFKHKPEENTEYKDSFPFDTTTIETTGRNEFLKSKFTVYRT